ncbi:hypothetical protein RHMOL_Rhmol01G0148300 [Rhododendron molle]|uniref:Uncharacterized protein n=1 Tax=Rhododendron molle TaxID=49168 RepID=A0ACC0Q4K7_RHOML|nr:hypothetical protein RHMOL_Rhmol01G0148300 [Rhododendron molle]
MSSSSAQVAHSPSVQPLRSDRRRRPLRQPCGRLFSAPDFDLTHRSRFLLHDPSDAMGLTGLLILPQPKSKPKRELEPRKLRQNRVSDKQPIDSKLAMSDHDS